MTQISAQPHPPLFRLPPGAQPDVPVILDGRTLLALPGETVAALLLRSVPVDSYRREDRHQQARAPLCMMGVCFECLTTIDGQPNQQACLIAVRPGMRIERQVPPGAPL